MKKKKAQRRARRKHHVLVASDLHQAIILSVDLTTSASSSSSAQPTPSDDPFESSPRGGDEHTTPPREYQAPSSPLYADVMRGNQPQEVLQPPMQPQLPREALQPPMQPQPPQGALQPPADAGLVNEARTPQLDDQDPRETPYRDALMRKGKLSMQCLDNYSEEEQDGCSTHCFTEDQDGSSVLSLSNDDDDFRNDTSVQMAHQRPLPPPARHRAIIVAGAGGTSGARDHLITQQALRPSVESPDITTTPYNDEHHNTPQADPPRARSYADILMGHHGPSPPPVSHGAHHNTPPADPPRARSYADILMGHHGPSPPPVSHHAANVAGASGTSGACDLLVPSVESQEIVDYTFEEQGNFNLDLMCVAQQITADMNWKDEVAIIKKACEPHLGYLKSVQNLGGYCKKHPLVRSVNIFNGKTTALLATAKGRLLVQSMVAVISECHSQKKSWNGEFDFEHIWIIEPRQSEDFMMILKDPVGYEGEALLQAMAKDLHKAAEILKPLYTVGVDYPVYFLEFIEDLEELTSELLAEEETLMEYLSYHPAIMPSTGRGTFISKLKSISTWSIMKLKPIPYPDDWRTIVASETGCKKSHGVIKMKKSHQKIMRKKSHEDIIDVLHDVYYHADNYENTASELIRFMRNVLEHGNEHDDRAIHGYDLELYLAKMFNRFLPVTLRAMLSSGCMEKFVGEDWSSYKMSKSNNWEPPWSE